MDEGVAIGGDFWIVIFCDFSSNFTKKVVFWHNLPEINGFLPNESQMAQIWVIC
jgi:hypothetical protein